MRPQSRLRRSPCPGPRPPAAQCYAGVRISASVVTVTLTRLPAYFSSTGRHSFWKVAHLQTVLSSVLGIFELFQHEKNGKFLERLQTFRKSLSICGRAGNQVFMWFVTFWGCPEPIFSTRGQIWCENETFAEINLLHKIASNSETVWSWEKFRTIPESCWHCLSTCTGCAAITSTIWLLQGVL